MTKEKALSLTPYVLTSNGNVATRCIDTKVQCTFIFVLLKPLWRHACACVCVRVCKVCVVGQGKVSERVPQDFNPGLKIPKL